AAWVPGKIALELYEKLVEPALWDPTFVKDFPREVSPLARPHRSTPGVTEHFDLVIARMEIGPAYSELTDPDEQRARFEAQQAARRRPGVRGRPDDDDPGRRGHHPGGHPVPAPAPRVRPGVALSRPPRSQAGPGASPPGTSGPPRAGTPRQRWRMRCASFIAAA